MNIGCRPAKVGETVDKGGGGKEGEEVRRNPVKVQSGWVGGGNRCNWRAVNGMMGVGERDVSHIVPTHEGARMV